MRTAGQGSRAAGGRGDGVGQGVGGGGGRGGGAGGGRRRAVGREAGEVR